MQRRHFLILPLLFAPVLAALGRDAPRGADAQRNKDSETAHVPSYQEDIRPLLQAKCSRCHGAKTRKADLDLTALTGILKGSESGPVIVPGKPDGSLLYEKVHDGAMPPGKKDRLSAAEVETIRRWIAAGAKADSAATAGVM